MDFSHFYLLGVHPYAPPRGLREACAVIGVAFVALSVLLYHDKTPFPGHAALIPCIGTALIIWANTHGRLTLVGRMLSHPLLVRVGQISYSLYLWHWPLIAYGDYLYLLESTEARWLVVLLSCWLGYLSWRWIEMPFREKRWFSGRRAIFGLFLGYALICILLGGTFRFLGSVTPPPLAKPKFSVTNSNINDPDLKLPILGAEKGPPSFLLWGDSHAMALAPLLEILGKEYGVQGSQLTVISTAPLVDWGVVSTWPLRQDERRDEDFRKRWASLALEAAAAKELRVVFLVGYWQPYSRPSFSRELQQTVQEFNRRGVRVVFVCDNPAQPISPRRQSELAYQGRWSWITSPAPISPELHKDNCSVVYKAVADLPVEADVVVVDLAPAILQWQSFLSEDNELLYFDDDHLSEAGALQLRPLFEPIFKELTH